MPNIACTDTANLAITINIPNPLTVPQNPAIALQD